MCGVIKSVLEYSVNICTGFTHYCHILLFHTLKNPLFSYGKVSCHLVVTEHRLRTATKHLAFRDLRKATPAGQNSLNQNLGL